MKGCVKTPGVLRPGFHPQGPKGFGLSCKHVVSNVSYQGTTSIVVWFTGRFGNPLMYWTIDCLLSQWRLGADGWISGN